MDSENNADHQRSQRQSESILSDDVRSRHGNFVAKPIENEAILIPMCDYVVYAQCIIRQILMDPSLSQNTLHGLLLQILFISKMAMDREDSETMTQLVIDFMNNLDVIYSRAKVSFVKFTFTEVVVFLCFHRRS